MSEAPGENEAPGATINRLPSPTPTASTMQSSITLKPLKSEGTTSYGSAPGSPTEVGTPTASGTPTGPGTPVDIENISAYYASQKFKQAQQENEAGPSDETKSVASKPVAAKPVAVKSGDGKAGGKNRKKAKTFEPYDVTEPMEPELCFPMYGILTNITEDAENWYHQVRVILSYGIEDMNFAGGRFKGMITGTYPLRDSLNKIMLSDVVTPAERATLIRFGRIYAKTQGDSRDGVVIDDDYIQACGLGGLRSALAVIFNSEAERRKYAPQPATDAEKLKAIQDTIARLELNNSASSTTGSGEQSSHKSADA